MKIKQVEELVGITSKNIRFYEDQGLLCPERADNGYREYHQSDVDTLKQIKLFRKFGVSVEEIKKVFEKKETLNECLDKHLIILKKEQDNLAHMQDLLTLILESGESIDSLDTEKWLDTVESLEKEGTGFVDLSKEDVHMKKKRGAYLSGIAGSIVMLLYVAMMVYAYIDEGMPLAVFLTLIIIPVGVIICIAYVVISRIKEINGGEEDEAAKY